MQILTSDPVLHFLEPEELTKLRRLSRDVKSHIDCHLQSKKQYVTNSKYRYYQYTTKDIIQHLPQLTHLTLSLPMWLSKENIEGCLPPTLKSLTLKVQGHFSWDSNGLHIVDFFMRDYYDFLEVIRDKLTKGELQLEEIHIRLDDTVQIEETYTTHEIMDYDDRMGPIYEEDVLFAHTKKFDPIHYWMLADISREDGTRMGALFMELLHANQATWKRITYPYDFFHAAAVEELYPQTTTSHNWTEDNETIFEHVGQLMYKAFQESTSENACEQCYSKAHDSP